MKTKLFILMAMAGSLVFTSCQKEDNVKIPANETTDLELVSSLNGTVIPDQYIVVLNDNTVKLKSASEASYDERVNEVKQLAGSMIRTKSTSYQVKQGFAEAVKGFSVVMSKEDLAQLQNDDRVKYIEQDKYVVLPYAKPGSGGGSTVQQVPYGIARVGTRDGSGKTAWIIDSGIDLDHPDLNVDLAKSKDFTGSRNGAEDENGHGTHCAGIVAAKDNSVGVIGVAAGASVVAVRVLDRRGSGSYSNVIAGVDYVAATAKSGDAANMSLGGPVSTALDDAVKAAASKGIKFALAAGNESDDADNHSPARANGNNIYTISAMDSNDNWAYFSNFGASVDYCEPGYSVYSTYKSGGYATLSGTSMAAPHMCGILLFGNPSTDGHVNGDPDGNPDPIGVL